VRLQKFLAHAGVCSRRQGEKLILQARVKVDGKTITELGFRLSSKTQKVTVDDKEVELVQVNIYLLMNKPAGLLTTLKDPHGRPTIMDILRDFPNRVFPVGRLDKDSEGLLLLTKHGELAYRLLHPRFKVAKKYIVTVSGRPSKQDIIAISRGIRIEGGFLTQPCKISLLCEKKDRCLFEIILTEGRKRQIREMFKVLNYKVIRLKRTELGPLKLGNLRAGRFRSLTPGEISAIKRSVGLLSDDL